MTGDKEFPKMPVAVAYRKHNADKYTSSTDNKGMAYIAEDKNGTKQLMVTIRTPLGRYQIRLQKEQLLKMIEENK